MSSRAKKCLVLTARLQDFRAAVFPTPRKPTFCRHGHFSSASSLRDRGSAMDRPIIFSPKRSKWVCPIVSTSRPKQSSERFNGGGGAQTVSLEARWALADWNKIPLNPTLFAEYKFGVGTIRHEEVPPPPGEEERKRRKKRAARPRFPMPTKFVCSLLRISASASNGR